MTYATKPQIQKINVLLKAMGLADKKSEVVSDYTDGRTASASKMSIEEARLLIMRLAEYDPSERLKSLIFSLAYQSGIIYGSSADDKKINSAKLNMFLGERGTVKKELNKMNYPELVRTHRQFEEILRNYQQNKDRKYAEAIVHNLLTELNLTTI